jgi:hypothetical protein
MKYSIIVAATASEAAPLQYLVRENCRHVVALTDNLSRLLSLVALWVNGTYPICVCFFTHISRVALRAFLHMRNLWLFGHPELT